MLGYKNRLLRINLKERAATEEALNMKWAKLYLGGKGLGVKYLYEELEAGTDPLSPENKLILMTGPVTGTSVPNSGKLEIISRSPASGTVLDCSIGGQISSEIKYAGFDGVIIEEAVDEPSYIYIEDRKVEILPADDLWGRGSHETETILVRRHGRECKVLSIGPAGENLLSMACINTDYYRQAGRGGIGSVMGSKNIKAIVVKGSGSVEIYDIEKLMLRLNEIIREDTLSEKNMWAYTDGTPMLLEMNQASGILPTRNFQQGTFDQYESIGSEAMMKARIGKRGCFSCPLACGNFTKVGDTTVEGPEFETLGIGGSSCGIGDLGAIVKFNKICDDMGLDTISTGSTIAWAMEMTERGIKDFGIRFGDVERYLEIPEEMGRKIGVGAELSLGTKELSKLYGGEDFAMQVKGLDFPAYDPRGSWGMGLAYAIADRGACHRRGLTVGHEAYHADFDAFTTDGKAELLIKLQNNKAVKSSAILCSFWKVDYETFAEIIHLVTGENFTPDDLRKIGERATAISRLFNNREGFTVKEDTLPNRIFNDALKSGATSGRTLPKGEFEEMRSEYYALSGWNPDGTIPDEKIKELEL